MSGLQAERTVLAWSRTVLALAAAAALIARSADSSFERVAVVPLAAGAVLLAVVSASRRRGKIARDFPVAAPSSWVFACLLGGIAALLVAALVVIL